MEHITSFAFETIHRHLATISTDSSIRIWDDKTFAQIYDFRASSEIPTCISCHPRKPIFACGFENGAVRFFSLSSTSLIHEYNQLTSQAVSVMFSPNAEYFVCSDNSGSLALLSATNDQFDVIRVLPNVSVRDVSPNTTVVAFDDTGQRLALIGPSEFLITVMDGRSLDEVSDYVP